VDGGVYWWWDNTGVTGTLVTNEETNMSHSCHTPVTLLSHSCHTVLGV